jgi:cyclophilin family peptidyl-prolyl cis-trans isomerase
LRREALALRIEAAAHAFAERGHKQTIVIASGGREWGGLIEADVIARELERHGVPPLAIVPERRSLTTRDNARFTAVALAQRGIVGVGVVTSAWHLPRAMALFRRRGVRVEGIAADEWDSRWSKRLWRWARERLLLWVQTALAFIAATTACSKGEPATRLEHDAASSARAMDVVIEKAEDLRRARDIPKDAQRSHDAAVRRQSARALARILDPDDAPLLRALEDEDEETVAWAGYGLGESCHGREEGHVRALAARLVSLPGHRAGASLDARAAIVRALGRCGGDLVEQMLRSLLREDDPAAEAVAYALGDLAAKRGSLSTESAVVLLDAAQRSPPLDAALYPFGRIEGSGVGELEPRLVAAARAALARPGAARIFAVRALARATKSKPAVELARVLTSEAFTPAERAEAARGLGRLHEPGQAALADVLALLFSGRPSLAGDSFGVLLAAVTAVGDSPSREMEAALWPVARADLPSGATASLARRISALRCVAAERLARGAWDSDVLAGCDVADGEAGERSRLAALDRGPLVKARRGPWLALARQTRHVRVREAAVDTAAHHPELGEAARSVLADALEATEPGVVATAANVVRTHPERVASDPHVAAAMRMAMARVWAADLVETKAALVDAALALGVPEARPYAQAACHDPNATIRARAASALAAAGDLEDCSASDAPSDPAPEVDQAIARPVRIVFETDAGSLGVTLDPALAQVAATRFVALARSGFYSGISIHRVVPGFVVQLGDRGGDGYGGSGKLLRCETSPVPFGTLDVGVALAGRDTGSSQFFVALARYPHLDGQYAWLGHADGDWNAVAEGDLVVRVRVEE